MLAIAQEPTKGRVYIGPVKEEPASVWQIPNVSADTNQIAANASWVKWRDAAFEMQRAENQKSMSNAEAARADYAANPRNRMLKPEAGDAQLTSERGILLGYDPNTVSVLMSGEDGKRWLLRAAGWGAPGDEPRRGLWVAFVPETATGYAFFVHSFGGSGRNN